MAVVPLDGKRTLEYWEGLFRTDPDPFGDSASALARWSLPTLLRNLPGGTLIELAPGNGRDLTYFAAHGFVASGVELSPSAARSANRRLAELRDEVPPRSWVVAGDALDVLRRAPAESWDIVYSNLFLTLLTDPLPRTAVLRESRRVLRKDGYFVGSVRSLQDPQYGKGAPVGPDEFDFAPTGPRIRFFSEPELRETLAPLFESVLIHEVTDGDPTFPLRLLLVIARPRPAVDDQKG